MLLDRIEKFLAKRLPEEVIWHEAPFKHGLLKHAFVT